MSCSSCHTFSAVVHLGAVLMHLKTLSLWPHRGDLLYEPLRSLPRKQRHLRAVRCTTVTQQLGTGSGDPATNWNFKLHVKCVPTWNVARAPGPISLLQQEVPWAPEEAPQSLLCAALPCCMVPMWQGQTKETSALLLTLPLWKERTRSGWGCSADRGVREAWFWWPTFIRQFFVVGTSSASSL